VVDDGNQAQHVVITARHDHPPPLASPAPRGGHSSRCAA
jgi:hypothetical protein